MSALLDRLDTDLKPLSAMSPPEPPDDDWESQEWTEALDLLNWLADQPEECISEMALSVLECAMHFGDSGQMRRMELLVLCFLRWFYAPVGPTKQKCYQLLTLLLQDQPPQEQHTETEAEKNPSPADSATRSAATSPQRGEVGRAGSSGQRSDSAEATPLPVGERSERNAVTLRVRGHTHPLRSAPLHQSCRRASRPTAPLQR